MEVCRNHTSGRYFICIDGIERSNKVKFVTPQGKIKCLERHLFDEPSDQDEDTMLSSSSITELQMKQYHTYMENRKKDHEARKRAQVQEDERMINALKEMFPGSTDFSPDEKIVLLKEMKKLLRKYKERT